MQIIPFHSDLIPQAADLFIENLTLQRENTPCLPATMLDRRLVCDKLSNFLNEKTAVAAVDSGRLLGYIGAYIVDGFRDTPQRGAYVPEWGHAVVDQELSERESARIYSARIYSAMYRSISAVWASAGCDIHAITLLAVNQEAQKTWYWHGFGLAVVDAVRSTLPLSSMPITLLQIRKAELKDIEALSMLELEHRQHYLNPPVFMAPCDPMNAQDWEQLISRPRNSAWLACSDHGPVGFIRFDAYDFDGVAITESDQAVFISGAYIRPEFRGQAAAPAILDAALRDYASQAITTCVVDFESFNPEAVVFWMKHFDPVCYSLIRVPEANPFHN